MNNLMHLQRSALLAFAAAAAVLVGTACSKDPAANSSAQPTAAATTPATPTTTATPQATPQAQTDAGAPPCANCPSGPQMGPGMMGPNHAMGPGMDMMHDGGHMR